MRLIITGGSDMKNMVTAILAVCSLNLIAQVTENGRTWATGEAVKAKSWKQPKGFTTAAKGNNARRYELFGVVAMGNSLIKLNPETGAVTKVGELGISISMSSLAFDPEGQLWGLSFSAPERPNRSVGAANQNPERQQRSRQMQTANKNPEMQKLIKERQERLKQLQKDPAGRQKYLADWRERRQKLLNKLGIQPVANRGLALGGQRLVLYQINTDTGKATVKQRFSPQGMGGGAGVEFSKNGDAIYWSNARTLCELNIATGAVKKVMDLPGGSYCLARHPSGNLLGIGIQSKELIEIDLAKKRVVKLKKLDLPNSAPSLAITRDNQLFIEVFGGKLYWMKNFQKAPVLLGTTGLTPWGLACRPIPQNNR